jgi:pimeloyl-ACP methyl ester carboxylesterase
VPPATATAPPALDTATPPGPAATPIAGLFDVGGHALYLDCQGVGSPTVVLDAGLGNPSAVWLGVQPGVAGFTRVCRYDRAGMGLSPRAAGPRTSAVMVEELRRLLSVAGVTGPYVLAGASFGGMNMRLYAGTYPQEVAGLVLVDAAHPDLDTRIEALLTPAQVTQRRTDLADNFEGVSFDNILESDAQARAAGPLPDIPLVVLRHGVPFPFDDPQIGAAVEQLWIELQTDYTHQAPRGKLVVAEQAGHRIHEVEPDLVVSAIREVVSAARTR